MLKKILLGLLVLVLLVVGTGLFFTFREPADLYSVTGEFPGCPSRPSCVSSVAQDEVHAITPLGYTGDPAAARERLEEVVRSMPDTRIVRESPDYLHVLFLTPTMRFHDDVELLVQPSGVVEVRSISRFGYRDRGVNRARVEALRAAFSK